MSSGYVVYVTGHRYWFPFPPGDYEYRVSLLDYIYPKLPLPKEGTKIDAYWTDDVDTFVRPE